MNLRTATALVSLVCISALGIACGGSPAPEAKAPEAPATPEATPPETPETPEAPAAGGEEKKEEGGEKAEEKSEEPAPAEGSEEPAEAPVEEKPGEVKEKPGGCGCRLADTRGQSSAALALALGALGLFSARRARRA